MTVADTVDVETPELVVVSYTVAGPATRANAALIDIICSFLAMIGLMMLFGSAVPQGAMARLNPSSAVGWTIAIFVIVQFVVLWGYYVLFEALNDGQTPGKSVMKLRVVRDGGLSITFGASAVRNFLRIIDMQPGIFYAIGFTSMIASSRGKRLGDLVAGTLVVREDIVPAPVTATPARKTGSGEDDSEPAILHAALTDQEFDVLDRYVQRRNALTPEFRESISLQLEQRFSTELSRIEGRSLQARILQLHNSEKRAREQGIAARHDTGAARERHAIIAANAPQWNAFAAKLTDAQQGGLKTLSEAEVREFVQDYRELTADLARLRTATRGRATPEVFFLNRLVAGAHNLLYRRKSLPARSIARLLVVTIPQEIRKSYRPIFLAAVLLFVPMLVSSVAVARDPDAANAFLPPQMFDRAEAGVRAAQSGDGYVDVPEIYRPALASRLISNNVQVAILAFGAGITAGIMTAFVLVTNGVSIGSVFGLYSSKGIFSLILAFVAPHGVLELSAICIAGGGGLLIGAGLLLPGDRTRRRALIENGRRAVVLLAGATFLLILAGLIEGFISPISYWPLELKLVVSALTAIFLYGYLRA